LRRTVAALLEWERPWPAWVGWPGAASVVRPLVLPTGLAVVAVGGATLGGSGKTPVAIAVAGELARRGCRVAFVAHGYRARPPVAAIRVARTDAVTAVGDEALLAARALEGLAPVVVGRTRTAALALAVELADVAVVDGLLQTSPRRVAYSLLALDRVRPWGSGRVVPFGDLRAAPGALRDSADESVVVGGPDCATAFSLSAPLPPGSRVGLVSSMARPVRFLEAALGAGVAGMFHVKRADHQPLSRREARALRTLAERHHLDAWCVDAKTGVLVESGLDLGPPVVVLQQELALSDALSARVLAALGARPASASS
jgi:tetraacyldisaccharide 4'-kinase